PRGATLPEPRTVVVELHPHLVRALRDLAVAVDVEPLDAEEVVAIPGPALLHVQAPAADAADLGDDPALRATRGHVDLSRHRVRRVLDADDRALRQPAHAPEEPLAVALHEHRPAGDGRKQSLGDAVVERQDVVAGRLDQEESLELMEAFGMLGRDVLAPRPAAAGVIALPTRGRRVVS